MCPNNVHAKTIDVCKRFLESHELARSGDETEGLLSECVVVCKRLENGLFDITNGVAKIAENSQDDTGNHFIVSKLTKIVFILE